MLEMLVHLDSPELLKRYSLFEIETDLFYVEEFDVSNLPRNWKVNPAPAGSAGMEAGAPLN